MGLLALALFLGLLHLAWPALMPAFMAAGFALTAYRARAWLNGGSAAYRCPRGRRCGFIPGSLPLFLPLGFDLAMLVLSSALLRQAWLNWQRGSAPAAILAACFSTPILLAGARAAGRPLLSKCLRPFRAGGEPDESNP